MEKSNNPGAHVKPVDMRIRRLARGFKAMNRKIVHFDGEVPQAPMKASELDPAARRVFKSADDMASDNVGELRGGRVPEQPGNRRSASNTHAATVPPSPDQR